jgi:hypothetical protein
MTQKYSLIQKIASLSLIVVFIMGCGGINAATPVSDNDAVGTMVASTLQAFQALASPTMAASETPLPPTAIPPTLPPPATFTRTPLPPAERIQFSTGATQTTASGPIQPGQSAYYVVQAEKDQPMLVSLSSLNNDAKLSIFGADGTVLLSQAAGTSDWQGLLPSTQDYYFQVTGGTASPNFTISVTIVARVSFSPGEIKVTLKGRTAQGFAVSYVVYALQGQKMDVILSVTGDQAALSVWGSTDGQPYARAQAGIKDFSFDLPATQDYIISVVPQGGQVIEYSMVVRIK